MIGEAFPEVLQAAQAGDSDALGRLYSECAPRVLGYLRSQGIAGHGFDTAAASVAHGREALGLDLRCELFTADHPAAVAFGADLLTAIMVMEHLSAPRLFVEEVAHYCVRRGARFYVSVPWLDDLGHLDFDDESKTYNVFNDVGAHVSYFSREGMTRMLADFGMKPVGAVTGLAWTGLLFEPAAAPPAP